jgi:hypothetical protein
MGSTLAVLTGGALFFLGAIFGRYLPARRKGPSEPQPKLRVRDCASTTATRADLRLPPEARRPDRPPPRPAKYRATTAAGGIGFLGDPRRDVTG